MFLRLILVFTFVLCVTPYTTTTEQKEKTSRRIISEGDYKFEFYITNEKISKYHLYRRYYWFKSGKINFSDGGSTGDLLHGTYTKIFRSKLLIEQGDFVFGLKDGKWTNWYDNGQLKQITNWKDGLKNGVFLQYSEEGVIIETGTYQLGRKKGMWIDHENGDTLYYKKGERVDSPMERKIKKEKEREEKGKFTERVGNFFRKIFPKKEKDENEESKPKKKKGKS